MNEQLIREAWDKLEYCVDAYIKYRQDIAYLGGKPEQPQRPDKYASVDDLIAFNKAYKQYDIDSDAYFINTRELEATYHMVLESVIAWWLHHKLDKHHSTRYVHAIFGDYSVDIRRHPDNGSMTIRVESVKK